jgi:Salmonella virulence plasmid 65kDa B protein
MLFKLRYASLLSSVKVAFRIAGTSLAIFCITLSQTPLTFAQESSADTTTSSDQSQSTFTESPVESSGPDPIPESPIIEATTDEPDQVEPADDVPSEEAIDEPSVSPLTPEQESMLSGLEDKLEKGEITQEEYEIQKQAIMSGQMADPNLALLAEEMSPEDQVVGQYISPAVQSAEGILKYEYQIAVPPGRGSVTPDLKLVYNSANKSLSSVIATGWNLNIPFIQRMNKSGVSNIYTENDFVSYFDGELSSQGSGVYKPRTENSSFLKYEFNNNVWTVTDKTGLVYVFGSTTQARQDNPGDSSKIFTWMLESVTDQNGNTASYTYYKDQGQIYPDEIHYNQENLFEIEFSRNSQSSVRKLYNT